jgi:hypothetical protein
MAGSAHTLGHPRSGNGHVEPRPRLAGDGLIALGALLLAASLALIALRFLSLKPGLFPIIVFGTFLGAALLMRPYWIVPAFIGLAWTSIEAGYFGGLPSPIEFGGLALLGYAAWQAVYRFGYAREVLFVCVLLAIPMLAAAVASPDGAALPFDTVKNLTFLFIVAMSLRSLGDFDRVAIVLALVGVGLGLGSLYSVFGSPTAIFPLKEPDVAFTTIPPRAAGPVGDPNFFALVMASLVPFALYLVARGGVRQLVGGASAVVLLGGVFATGSRGGLIACAAAIIGAGIVMPVFRLRVAAAAVVLFALISLPLFATQLQDAGARSNEGRKTENLVAVAMFADHPVTGVGPGQYQERYRDYSRRIGNDPRPVREAHSLPLEIAAEQGLGGILGWSIAFLTVFRFGFSRGVWQLLVGRAIVLSILTYMTASLFLHGSHLRLLWVLLGLVLALGHVLERERGARARGRAAPA